MSEAPLASLTREELEAEVLRLRAIVQATGAAAFPPAARHDKARSRAVLENTTQFAIVVSDRSGRITDWNPGAEQVMGWTAGEMGAAALTHRLLAFARRQTLAPRPINVNQLVDGLTELIQRTVGPGIQVETVGAAGLWPALVDRPHDPPSPAPRTVRRS